MPHILSPVLAIESGDVLSLGLLALAILSFFLGLAGLAAVWRFRPGAFSRAVRRQAWRALIPLVAVVLINLVGIPAAGIVGHQAMETRPARATVSADAEVFKLVVLVGMLIVLLFTNYLAVSLQRRLGQLRLHGEADPQITRRITRPPRMAVFMRENMIPGTALLAISILIWYLIDKQLSDTVPLEADVQIELQTGDEDWRWIVIDHPTTINIQLQGPREQIARLQAATEVQLVVRHAPEDTGSPTDIQRIPIDSDAVELRFDGSRKPDNVTLSSTTPDIRIELARMRDPQPMRISEEWVLRAMVDRPNNLVPKIRSIDPLDVWLVYPMVPESPITELSFQTHSLQQLQSASLDQVRVRTLDIAVPPERHLRIFADRELTRPVTTVRVTFEFDTSPPPIERPIDEVRRTIRTASSLVERGVRMELPVHNGAIRVRGPREVVDSMTANDVELVLVINDAAIDWERFEREGRFAVPDCRYRLAGRGRWSRGLPPGVELVEPRPDSSIAVTLIR